MAYRETSRTRAKAQRRRARIEEATRHVIARGGFASASVAAVAREAECSTGLIYTYYSNRDELLGTVFAHASQHELAVVTTAIESSTSAVEIVDALLDVFIRRAVAGRTLAHALLFEEVPDTVQIERRAFRRGYVAALATGLTGRYAVDIPAEVVARSLVGSIVENLVDVLDPARERPSAPQVEALTAALSTFARTAIGQPRTARGEQ